jgi:hypothetical protein
MSSEQNTLKVTTFEGWVHKHVDKSIEFCNDCPINPNDCNLACPYRDALFVHLSDLKEWLQKKPADVCLREQAYLDKNKLLRGLDK